jgi:HD-like signal output (HDOD) protein
MTTPALIRPPATGAPPPARLAAQAPSAQARRISEELEQARRSSALQQIRIPPCPELLARLHRALESAEPDLNEITRIAGSDVAMAATLLRNANSARWQAGDGPAVQTVGQALNRIGLDAAAAILTEVLLRQALPTQHPLLKGFWQQSSLRAAAMGFIARQLPGTVPELAELFGLFCHVGVPVLLQRMPGYSGTLAEAAARRDRGMVATENANHRTDHAVVGALVARTWQLAPVVMAAIRLHHETRFDSFEDAEAATLVAMGVLAERAMREREGLPADADNLRQWPAALAWLGLDDGSVADWNERLHAELDDALARGG